MSNIQIKTATTPVQIKCKVKINSNDRCPNLHSYPAEKHGSELGDSLSVSPIQKTKSRLKETRDGVACSEILIEQADCPLVNILFYWDQFYMKKLKALVDKHSDAWLDKCGDDDDLETDHETGMPTRADNKKWVRITFAVDNTTLAAEIDAFFARFRYAEVRCLESAATELLATHAHYMQSRRIHFAVSLSAVADAAAADGADQDQNTATKLVEIVGRVEHVRKFARRLRIAHELARNDTVYTVPGLKRFEVHALAASDIERQLNRAFACYGGLRMQLNEQAAACRFVCRYSAFAAAMRTLDEFFAGLLTAHVHRNITEPLKAFVAAKRRPFEQWLVDMQLRVSIDYEVMPQCEGLMVYASDERCLSQFVAVMESADEFTTLRIPLIERGADNCDDSDRDTGHRQLQSHVDAEFNLNDACLALVILRADEAVVSGRLSDCLRIEKQISSTLAKQRVLDQATILTTGASN